MTQLKTMDCTIKGKVARIILNRPELLNAMNNEATIDINKYFK